MPARKIANIIQGRPLVSAEKNMTVRAACQLMTGKNIGALLVQEAGKIIGIFTERDVLNKIISASLSPDETTLEKVMAHNPQSIRADKPLAYALYMMAEGGFRHVPVVDADGVPVGMVSARDALGQDMLELERELNHQRELESSIGY